MSLLSLFLDIFNCLSMVLNEDILKQCLLIFVFEIFSVLPQLLFPLSTIFATILLIYESVYAFWKPFLILLRNYSPHIVSLILKCQHRLQIWSKLWLELHPKFPLCVFKLMVKLTVVGQLHYLLFVQVSTPYVLVIFSISIKLRLRLLFSHRQRGSPNLIVNEWSIRGKFANNMIRFNLLNPKIHMLNLRQANLELSFFVVGSIWVYLSFFISKWEVVFVVSQKRWSHHPMDVILVLSQLHNPLPLNHTEILTSFLIIGISIEPDYLLGSGLNCFWWIVWSIYFFLLSGEDPCLS